MSVPPMTAKILFLADMDDGKRKIETELELGVVAEHWNLSPAGIRELLVDTQDAIQYQINTLTKENN